MSATSDPSSACLPGDLPGELPDDRTGPMLRRRHVLGLLGAAAAIRPGPARAAELTQVATFGQQVTGVAVSPRGRVFVCFPRWETDGPLSVAELRDGALRPYPNAEWNGWSNLKPLTPADHLVCVQSVTVDARGFLWIVDAAAPGNAAIVPGGPKLVKVDLASDRVVQVVPLGPDLAPQGSYLNDVRVSPDGYHAYLTDSGVRGALIVLDLRNGRGRRVLDGHRSTQADPGVTVQADGQALMMPDRRRLTVGADGIALDPLGHTVYWQALTGRTLYRIPTAALVDDRMLPAQLATQVERVGTTCVADGYWMDHRGRLFVTSPEDNAVKLRQPDGTLAVVVQDARLRWPDSLAEAPDGTLFVTASCIQDMARWHAGGPRTVQPWALFSFRPGT